MTQNKLKLFTTHLTLVAIFCGAVTLSGCMRRKQSQVYSSLEEAQGSVKSNRGLASDTAAVEDGQPLERLPNLDADAAVDNLSGSIAEVRDEVSSRASEAVGSVDGFARYTVKKGDTLMKIAFELYGDIDRWKDLYRLNKNKLHNRIQLSAGQNLAYVPAETTPQTHPEGEPYLIKVGDSLGSISQDVYGVRKRWRELYEHNKTLIKDPNRIFAGFYLYYQITEQQRAQAAVYKKRAQRLALKKAAEAPSVPVDNFGAPQGDATTFGYETVAPAPAPVMGPPLPPSRGISSLKNSANP